jgi:alkanesulfonate monooxygenase SsuD/methylene tetrahydromethanopterin reductase-like flavin-dependent oxidoreductase (luciferase family)
VVEPLRYSLAGTLTLTWPEVVDVARTAERLGFDTFYATDHLMGVAGFQPELGVLDALSLAVALGPLTERIRLGCMVSPVTMRHPVMLARALQTLDVITGGRAEIGLGAGWNAQEHEVFGFGFPPPGERLAMLAAAAETIAALWTADGPVSVGGRYPLTGAQLRPRPVQRPAPILIGGASKQSVAIAARLATGWNGTGARAGIAERITELREREAACGREGQVETSVMVSVRLTEGAGAGDGGGFAGPPGAIAEYLASFAGIGVQRIVLSTPRPWHPAKLEALAAAAGLFPAGRALRRGAGRGGHLAEQVARARNAGVQVGEEAVDSLPLGLDGDPEFLLQPQAFRGQPPAVSRAGVLVPPGLLDLREPVFVAQDDGDLVEVQPEQGLQLPDARHPGQVVLGVAAHAAGRAGAGGEQADLLVIAERPF